MEGGWVIGYRVGDLKFSSICTSQSKKMYPVILKGGRHKVIPVGKSLEKEQQINKICLFCVPVPCSLMEGGGGGGGGFF